MNGRTCSAVLMLGLWIGGCATTREPTVSGELGPRPATTDTAQQADEGTLVVYSSYEVTPTPNRFDPAAPQHTPYDVESLDGRLLKHVRNHPDDLLTEPERVALPAGHYRIAASAQEYGRIVVPVLVVAGETTTIHLDSNDFTAAHRTPNAAMVRLPDGQIVGWLQGRPAGPAVKR